jgi:hypothetical protein
MGFSSDIMHTIVEKELKRHYPASEGWTLQPVPVKVGKDEIYTLSRRTGGKNETVFAGITFEKTISNELVGELSASLKSRAAMRSVAHLALIVPQETGTGNVLQTVTVSRMRAFRYAGDDLMWLKHAAQKA